MSLADILGSCSFLEPVYSWTYCFPRNSKDFQVSFSPFALKNTSFFLERMGITAVPWAQHFFSLTFFNLMGATVSNVLEKIVPMLLVIVSS